MKIISGVFLSLFLFTSVVFGRTFHVSTKGNDASPGTMAAPLRTIQRAADLAQPGDSIIVHDGIYREYINPPRGGTSNSKRIVYEAAPGEKVVIKGSEVIKNWINVKGDVWKVKIPNTFFGNFNPYSDTLHGDWYNRRGRTRHTGCVYLNGKWLSEAANLKDIFKPSESSAALWFGKVGDDTTTIWAQFKGVNPNKQLVEINVRQCVFFPKDTGINYITVRGFTMEQAATQWAAPTTLQVGVIGPHWSKGWIIEDNVIKYSMCAGISLGKYGDKWNNTADNTASGFVGTINRALAHGWTRENIGHHIIRNNVISHCGEDGIVGALGAIFSTITNNAIYDIDAKGWLAGAEIAGIKIHAAVDVSIAKNHIYNNNCLGIWLDWMAQGTRVSQNLLNNNNSGDMFVEVDHGPFMVDNNLFLSPVSITIRSQGGAYCHNLFAGRVNVMPYDARKTPFLKAHSTVIAGLHDNPLGDSQFYNNIFTKQSQLNKYDSAALPSKMDGNVFLNEAKPPDIETNPIVDPHFNPKIKLIKKTDGFYLQIKLDKVWIKKRKRQLVTTALLGKTAISNLPYEQPDGKPIQINADYLGKPRNKNNPAPGPFESFKTGLNTFKVF